MNGISFGALLSAHQYRLLSYGIKQTIQMILALAAAGVINLVVSTAGSIVRNSPAPNDLTKDGMPDSLFNPVQIEDDRMKFLPGLAWIYTYGLSDPVQIISGLGGRFVDVAMQGQ